MTLDEEKYLWRRYFASVRSHISLIDAVTNERKTVTSVGEPNVFQKNFGDEHNRVFVFNQVLLGPTPYHGGGIDFQVGLIKAKLKDDDLTQPFFKFLTSVSKLSGVSVPSKAGDYSSAIKEGVESVLNLKENVLEVSYSTNLPKPEAGHYVIFKTRHEDYMPDVTDLKNILDEATWLDPTDSSILRKNMQPSRGEIIILRSPQWGTPDHGDKTSMVIVEVQKSCHREDWRALDEIKKFYQSFVATRALLIAQHKTLDQILSQGQYTQFVSALYLSGNLLPHDRHTIMELVRQDTIRLINSFPDSAEKTEKKEKDSSKKPLKAGTQE